MHRLHNNIRWKEISVVLLSPLIFSSYCNAGPQSCSNFTIDQLAAGHNEVPQNPYNSPGGGAGTIPCESDNSGDAQRYLRYLETNCIKDNEDDDHKCRQIETQLLWTDRNPKPGEVSGSRMLDQFHQKVWEFVEKERDEASRKSILPPCDSPVVQKSVIDAVMKSPVGKTTGLEILKLKSARQIGYVKEKDERICQAIAFTNAGSKVAVFRLTSDEDSFYVEVSLSP